jgi:hypothetical protein
MKFLTENFFFHKRNSQTAEYADQNRHVTDLRDTWVYKNT